MVHLDGAYKFIQAPAEQSIEINRWHHIAGVFDGAELRLYLDGRQIGATPAAGVRTTNELPLMIGADPNGRGLPQSVFDGLIDEVRISTTARYSGESFVPPRRHTADSDTFLLLPLDGLAGAFVPDLSSHRRLALPVKGTEFRAADPSS